MMGRYWDCPLCYSRLHGARWVSLRFDGSGAEHGWRWELFAADTRGEPVCSGPLGLRYPAGTEEARRLSQVSADRLLQKWRDAHPEHRRHFVLIERDVIAF